MLTVHHLNDSRSQRILWLHGLSVTPGWNMGLEIVAIHPNCGGTWRRPMKRRHSSPVM